MKLYFFEIDGYGSSYCTMANSKEDALKYLINYFKKEAEEYGYTATAHDGSKYITYSGRNYYEWNDALLTNELPKYYTLKEYDEGYIIHTETS